MGPMGLISIFGEGGGHDLSGFVGSGLDVGGPGGGVAGLDLPLVEEAVGGVEGEVVPDLVVVEAGEGYEFWPG